MSTLVRPGAHHGAHHQAHQEAQPLRAPAGHGLPPAARAGDEQLRAELDAAVRLATAVTGAARAAVTLAAATAGPEGAGCDEGAEPSCPHARGGEGAVAGHASVPLLTGEGHSLGSLCVLDARPRPLTPAQRAHLADLADLVVGLLERHREQRAARRLLEEVEEQRELAQLTLAELQEREEFTTALLDTVDVGVLACDAEGVLTVANPAARRMHALDAPLLSADGASALAPHEVPLQRALREGAVGAADLLIAVPGREVVRVRADGRALADDDGRPLGAVVVLRDTTADHARVAALERAGEQLRRQGGQLAAAVAELRRSNDELADLAAVASHDLATPLTAVTGYLELLEEVHGADLGEQGRGWLATALRAAHRMHGLLTSLLEHARADEAPRESDRDGDRDGARGGDRPAAAGPLPEPVDVAALLAAVVEDLGPAAAGAAITSTGTAAHARADPVRLRQLLQNLVGNAVRHRVPGRPCRVQVQVGDLPGGGWQLAVVDNGRGIPAADRERVFAMFAVGEGRPGGAPAPGGHGIGLATCRRVVEGHGGRIVAEDTPGGGGKVQRRVA
ncbi:PAS domain-containing protein, partial [Kineococcus sp. T13]|uniref:ATP-binding protein n=1 Tax=Kineococcus vitellinus TaxID=2696565 RepID=UPI001411FCE9|nr:PAS domain-containing protein [Kineococcus vitellinus]